MSSGGVGVMEKPIQFQQQRQQQPQSQEAALKCPRCDSSNTKFCYYNNYSLSQPRHFCKACKRYWTRGGTLRNVPVGGGCRKNKRIKRPITTSTTHVAAAPPSANHHQTNPNPNDHNNRPSSTTSNSNHHHLNPLFYSGLLPPQNPNNYPRFDTTSGYDLLHQQAATGLGFSGHNSSSNLLTFSSYMMSSPPAAMLYAGGGSTTNSSSTLPTTTTTTMASLLASSLHQQQQQQQSRFMGEFASSTYDHDAMDVKDLKMEEVAQINRPRMEWNNNNNFHGCQQNNNNKNDDQMEDPNSILWDSNEGGSVWLHDPTNNNIGSSVPSLI